MATPNKDELVQKAKLAEQANRYNDMLLTMKSVAEMGQALNKDERNLFYLAYKNIINARRTSWREISEIEKGPEETTQTRQMAQEYRLKIQSELKTLCKEAIELLDKYLIPSCIGDTEAQVFYLKMKGDYYRYIAEAETGDQRAQVMRYSEKAYQDAMNISQAKMTPTHPVRLGLAVNFSIFYYEMLNARDKACDLARQAFDEAIAELDTLNEDSYKDSTIIMRLLRDNLTLWTTDGQTDDLQDPDFSNINVNNIAD